MKTTKSTPPKAPGAPRAKHPAARPTNAAPNATFNAQSRRVLAQHYRAKYGVK